MLDWAGVENPDKAVRSAGFPYNIANHHSELRKTEKTRCYILAEMIIINYQIKRVKRRIFYHIYL